MTTPVPVLLVGSDERYASAFEAHPGFVVAGVAAPNSDGLEAALPAASVVFVAAGTERQTWELAGRAQRAGKVAIVGHYSRFAPTLFATMTAVRAGRVGLPWNVQVDYIVDSQADALDIAVAPIDFVAALSGLAVRRVHALPAGDNGKLMLLLLDHDHGLTSTIAVGRTAGVPGRHRYRISGSHGVMLVDADKPALTVTTANGQNRRWLPADVLRRVLDEAHAVATGSRPATVGMVDAVNALAVVAAARISMDKGGPAACG